MAATSIISASISINQADVPTDPNHALTLTFGTIGRTITIQTGDLHPSILTQALMHGLKQKLVDAAAIARNPETGRSATAQDKFDAVAVVYERLLAGNWNAPREGGETGGLLLRALAQMTGKSVADLKPTYDDYTDEQKAALRKNPKVAAIIATLRPVPKVDDSIDTEALLASIKA